jgi:phosphogluconate dehydratase
LVPEASKGGALAKIHNGDLIRLDATTGVLSASVDERTMNERELATAPLTVRTVGRGLFGNNRRAVSSAEEGASSLFN